jgi:hypothetical protein
MILLGCEQGVELTVEEQTGGDPHRGKQMIQAYGCQSCHTIPGVGGANELVGPPPGQMALQSTSPASCVPHRRARPLRYQAREPGGCPCRESFGAEHNAGANGVLHESIGALLIDGIRGPVAGAVGRGDDGGFQCDQGIDHTSDAVMEERRP